MLVVFWGPVHGQVRTTSNMAAAATSIALDYHVRILMTHTRIGDSTLEGGFGKVRQVHRSALAEIGVDAIIRLVQCSMLTPQKIRDHAESLLKDRLDLLAGPSLQDRETMIQLMPHIIGTYKQCYELLFVDVSPGADDELSSLVLRYADLIVVNLNQSQALLDTYFSGKGRPAVFEEKPILYCLGGYEQKSKLSIERICKQYGISKKQIGAVPYDVRYLDAQNDQNIVDFLMRARMARKKFLEFNENVHFTETVRRMGKRILSALDMQVITEDDDD